MNKPLTIILIIAVLVAGIWLIYKAPSQASSIKIGFIGPLTGDASSLGTVARTAVEVAADEINKAGGINGKKLEVIYEDGQCNAKAAATAASKLIDIDQVSVIIGGLCSTETSAFAPAAMEKKVVVFSYCSSAPSLSNTGEYFFRSYPSDAFQGKFAAEYAYQKLGARKVAIGYHVSDWGTGIKDVFENRFRELGSQIVAEEGAPQDSRDYRTLLSKLKVANPDLIFFPMYPEGSIVALKQAQELGIKTKFYGGDAWADTKLWKEASGKGDFIYSEVLTPALSSDFQEKILSKTGGEEVPLCAPQAYDNMNMIAEVMRKVGTDRDKIQAELRNLHYAGVSGDKSFDEHGDIASAQYIVKKIENGTAVEVK